MKYAPKHSAGTPSTPEDTPGYRPQHSTPADYGFKDTGYEGQHFSEQYAPQHLMSPRQFAGQQTGVKNTVGSTLNVITGAIQRNQALRRGGLLGALRYTIGAPQIDRRAREIYQGDILQNLSRPEGD